MCHKLKTFLKSKESYLCVTGRHVYECSSKVMFAIVLLLTIPLQEVIASTCSFLEKTCIKYSSTWCCRIYEYCGSYSGSCLSYTTIRTTTTTTAQPSRFTDLPNGAIVTIIALPIFFCIIFCGCYASSSQQRQNTSHTSSNANSSFRPSRHQRQSSPNRINPVVAPPPIPTFYEDAPPSYETAVADLSPKTPPLTANVDRTNL
ncbi:unnamed protein product [Adineta ricciae]|uniref:Uncharacterized protein n=1 Tax=Adineta ricciae TaxID=249248 RepID=A0A814PTW3_ADIRI|nr:unnamed protein product [Adineta ricciae]